MEPKQVSFNLAGRDFSLETGKLAQQAQGSIKASLGDTVILATAQMSDRPREDCDYFPMMVDYEERFYATGKISGSRFIKREGRPSENAILTSRLIDRPLRPLFPKGMVNDVQIICTVLSADMEVDPGTTAINAASAALLISGMPFHGPVGAVRIGYIKDSNDEEQLVVNPTYEQTENGRLNLVVTGTKDAITMVEAAAKEVPEEVILEALELAHTHIRKLCELQEELRDQIKPQELSYETRSVSEDAENAVHETITDAMLDSVQGTSKHEFKEKLHELEAQLIEKYQKQIEDETLKANNLKEILLEKIEKRMRQSILEKEQRIDGRKPDEIRSLQCEVGILPRTHGSALFQRGETQALTTTTLGSPGAAQLIDTMDSDTTKGYMHHYNFPPYATGETKPMRGTSRREIGHGNLAERALLPVLPDKEAFPYTMRLVSEILTCNGSSSMASVCGSTLSLMDAGVPISKPVTGIAMGLITEPGFSEKGGQGNYKILTDIQGLEDFAGDMDFKVTGTEDGITALQMDIKVKGLSVEILRQALEQSKAARADVLKAMLAAISEPRDKLSAHAPMITSIRIHPDQIREVIGRGGETIQKITADTGVEMDIEDDGLVMITAPDQESGEKALKIVKQITYIPKAGDEFDGKVTRIMDFGAFVEFVPGKEGLVHISKLAPYRVNRVEDVVKMDDKVKVKLVEIDDQGRYNLARIFPPGEKPSRPPSEPPSGPRPGSSGPRPGSSSGPPRPSSGPRPH